jgi:hypothetical protein
VLIRSSLAAAALGFATAAIAQAPAQPAASAPKTIAKADLTKGLDTRFAAIDANKDGSLSKDEITAAQTRAIAQARAAQQQRLEAEYKKLDTDKNGSLSLAEFKAVANPINAPESPDQMIADLDANKDGKVSSGEYRSKPIANFDRLDANKDGILTPQEVAAARRR